MQFALNSASTFIMTSEATSGISNYVEVVYFMGGNAVATF